MIKLSLKGDLGLTRLKTGNRNSRLWGERGAKYVPREGDMKSGGFSKGQPSCRQQSLLDAYYQ